MSETKSAAEIWDEIYRAGSGVTSGQPGRLLRRFAEGLAPGTVLELGCGKGDDAVWLAGLGWQVTAVDISPTAIGYAADNARRAGVAERIVFEQHDLAKTFPEGSFDLVMANFLHSPADFPRMAVLRRAAQAVRAGGRLLIIEHASRAPWSKFAETTVFATAAETFAGLALEAPEWVPMAVEAISREATGPEGQVATMVDNVVLVERRAP